MDKIILAIVGLPGSGKTEATNYLKSRTSWPSIYFGQPVMDEVAKRGLAANQENEKPVREELRVKYGMGAMAVLNIDRIKEIFINSSLIIESFYSWEEYVLMKKEFGDSFKVLAVYSNFKTRAARMASREIRPLSGADLNLRDIAQIENLHQAGPIARADWTVVNEGSKEELYGKMDEVLFQISK